MERGAVARKHMRNNSSSIKSPARHDRNKSSAQQSMTPPTTGTQEQSSSQRSKSQDRHFIGNVGSGGKLYLAPSRLPHQVNVFPATPPDTAHGERGWPIRDSIVSGTWTPRPRLAYDDGVSVPPMSLANAARRRTRSRSVSTIEQTAKNTHDPERSRSSMEMTGSLLSLRIPHYRLGTPRFSDRGTAYIRSSVLSDSTDDRSSVLTQQGGFDRLFPLPPGSRANHASRHSTPHHLHPSAAYNARTSHKPIPRAMPADEDDPTSVFDKIEANPNDPAIVRFSTQGRVLAATIPRLIVQITSPRFLDYELLSDFFLTYRGFLTSRELLDWLMIRMCWAMKHISDAGRIVRVRTFVALRHWILNYFTDDFASSLELRQQFCAYVNGLAAQLRQRDDSVTSELNILGELKKCWRRTSALFWPIPDTMDSPIDEDIYPGGTFGLNSSEIGHAQDSPDQAFASQLIAIDQRTNQKVRVVSVNSTNSAMLVQRGSIPASPMSEDSLHILSCSVPFLKKLRPDSQAEKRAQKSAPRPVMPQRHQNAQQPQDMKTESDMVLSRHTRSDLAASFDLDQLPSITLSGGLVRGILLQPSPPTLQRHAPRTPPMESRTSDDDYFDGSSQLGVKRIVGDVRRALSIKKANSETSGRTHRSTTSGSRGSNHLRDEHPPPSVPSAPSTKPSMSFTPRQDVLAARLQKSYQKHFIHADTDEPRGDYLTQQTSSIRPLSIGEFGARLGSQTTTRSPSIVIVDATSRPASPARIEGFTEHLSVMPLFPGIMDVQRSSSDARTRNSTAAIRLEERASTTAGGQPEKRASTTAGVQPEKRASTTAGVQLEKRASTTAGALQEERPTITAGVQLERRAPSPLEQASQSIDGRLHGSFIFPPPLKPTSEGSDIDEQQQMRPTPHQLRRRPGGDLKAADHVHELESKDATLSLTDSLTPATSQSRSLTSNFKFPYSAGTSRSLAKASSQSHVRPSLRSNAQQPAKFRADSGSSGGVEDALARLEGKKPGTRRRRSGMSWLELPTNEESPENAVATPKSTDFEMTNPGSPSQVARVYRVSRADVSEEGSMFDQLPTNTQEPMIGRASSLDNNPVYVLTHTTSEKSRKADGLSAAITIQSSFLLGDDQSLSDISTDIADDADEDSAGVRSFFFDDAADDEAVVKIPRPLFSPTSDHGQAPDPSTLKIANSAAKILGLPAGSLMAEVMQTKPKRRQPDEGQHFPFVLAFESKVVAEQLCIIEKDALDEIDWKDLIALNWHHTPSNIRNWADYLQQENSNGVDLVVARFNLVVKWVVSECVLTTSLVERARCITKYIHIATHCLRLRNYASMVQITLALLSSDLARLQKTWAFVLPVDKQMLNHLEILSQPLRNFQNLRAEMESASLDEGCIPFIGLYTHDLMYNAQRPAWLDTVPPTNPSSPNLINFERYQTAATVTKSLLRLLDASSCYVFRPHPEALSRCLWLAALEDADIREISMDLE